MMSFLILLGAIAVSFLVGYYTGLNKCRNEKSDLLDG